MEHPLLLSRKANSYLFLADADVMFFVCFRRRLPDLSRTHRGQEMWGEDSSFSSDEVRLVRAFREHPLDFLQQDRHDCIWLQPLLFPGNQPDVEEEETTHMTSKQILRLLTGWYPLVHYSTWLKLLEMAMKGTATAREMLAMRLPDRNILKDLRQILFAADSDIPSTHVETYKQRYNTLCNKLGTISLLGMSYPILAVLNVVDVLKYWHMAYDEEFPTTASGSSSRRNERGV